MNATERAKALLRTSAPRRDAGPTSDEIAAAIRAAENDALERAWAVVDEEARTVDNGYAAVVLRRAANKVLALKEPTP